MKKQLSRSLPKSEPPAAATATRGGRKSGQRTLNREAVVAAALAEIDKNGLEDFSLRSVAKALGVYPTAVAWHVSSRSQLLAEVARLVQQDVLPPGFHDSWQGYLREFFQRFRAAIRRHPNAAPLIGAQLIANPTIELDFVERLLAVLAHAGLTGMHLVAAYNAVIAAAVGFTTQEFAPMPMEDTRTWQRQVRERLQSTPESRYPLLARNIKLLGNRAFTLRWQNGTEAPLDDSFEAFVDIFIAGLEHFASRR